MKRSCGMSSKDFKYNFILKSLTLKFAHSVIFECIIQFLFPKPWQNVMFIYIFAIQLYTTKTVMQAKDSGVREVCGIWGFWALPPSCSINGGPGFTPGKLFENAICHVVHFGNVWVKFCKSRSIQDLQDTFAKSQDFTG